MSRDGREHPADAVRDGATRLGIAETGFAIACGWVVAGVCFLAGPPDPAAEAAFAFALVWWVPVVLVIRSDLAEYLIPDGATVAVGILGLAEAAAAAFASGLGVGDASLAAASALALGLGAALLFFGVAELFRRFGTREALGFGDVKLAGALAVWLGPGDAAMALEIAAVGALAALLVARRGAVRDTAVPFGAFLAPAAWLVFVAGPPIRAAWP